jgi:transcriptional regulator with XRE-family HTH domain
VVGRGWVFDDPCQVGWFRFDEIGDGRKDGGGVTEQPAATETIGRRLRRLRLERKLSQRELSAPGVSYAYISRIEAGTRQPSVKALRKLAAKLGVSPDYLETGMDVRDVELRELRLADAELELRLTPDTGSAVAQLQELLDEAIAAGDLPSATRARIGLGLAAAERGRPAEAVELLEHAIEAGDVRPAARPDVFTTLGRAYAATGAARRAVDLFGRCLEELEREAPSDTAALVRFKTYLSYALTDLGDLEGAQAALTEALEQAESLADPYTRIRLYWSLARLAGYSGRPSGALEHYRRAIALLQATEDTLHLARANLGYAWTLLAAGRAEDAAEPLEVAERLFGPNPAPQDLYGLRTEQAKLAVALGDGQTGAARAREALDALGDTDPGEQGVAWLALGDALRLERDPAGAEDAYQHSADAFEHGGRPGDAAQAYRAWGRLLRESGREAEALDVLEKAADAAVRAPAAARAEA